ncbi:MAG: hypothetical protein MZU97_17210 [Bacillus subtilis]|nr:hypothetical protein [Bacillus subtilis]
MHSHQSHAEKRQSLFADLTQRRLWHYPRRRFGQTRTGARSSNAKTKSSNASPAASACCSKRTASTFIRAKESIVGCKNHPSNGETILKPNILILATGASNIVPGDSRTQGRPTIKASSWATKQLLSMLDKMPKSARRYRRRRHRHRIRNDVRISLAPKSPSLKNSRSSSPRSTTKSAIRT